MLVQKIAQSQYQNFPNFRPDAQCCIFAQCPTYWGELGRAPGISGPGENWASSGAYLSIENAVMLY